MSTRKHNDFLEAVESDDNGSDGYNSEAEDLRKGASNKRRKVTSDDESDVDFSDDEVEMKDAPALSDEEKADTTDKPAKRLRRSKPEDDLPGISRPLTKKNLVATEAAIKKSGVVYLSRIPPFMKPQKLRSLLTPFGEINRIFMTPEDPASHTRRVKSGGNKKRSFTDGWVEFMNKSDAKKACELLNAQIIGGKKGTYYHDDVWNLLYLKGFKWTHLTQQIAAENAERASRRQAEISKVTRENKEFLKNVEESKIVKGMQAKEAEKAKKRAAEAKSEGGAEKSDEPPKKKKAGARQRTYEQTKTAPKSDGNKQMMDKVLSSIF